MKRKLLLIFFLIFLGWPATVFGQTSSENYQNFVQSYRRYQELIAPFNSQKSRYQTYQTVDTLADFLEASKALTSAEVESITAYTAFIRSLLAEATQILNYQENYLYVKLDDQLAYLALAKDRIASLSSLTETQNFLTELKDHYQAITQISYEIKSIIEIGSAEKILNNVKTERDKINQLLLSQESSASAQINAAKERFAKQDEEIAAVEELLSQEKQLQKNNDNQKMEKVAAKVRQISDNIYTKLNKIVSEYQNIVYSLKK